MRGAILVSGIDGKDIRGIGLDATCLLVLLGADGVTLREHNTMLWMDHRALEQA